MKRAVLLALPLSLAACAQTDTNDDAVAKACLAGSLAIGSANAIMVATDASNEAIARVSALAKAVQDLCADGARPTPEQIVAAVNALTAELAAIEAAKKRPATEASPDGAN